MMFSVIIPVYNNESYLHEALDSLLAQSYGGWEAVCVDDGSNDGCGIILDEYATKDSRFRVIHKANAGVSAARNTGLDVAQGDWILFLDADDAFAPWALECLSRAVIKDLRVDFVMFRHQSIDDCSAPMPAREDAAGHSPTILSIDSASSARIAYERVNGVLLAWGGCHRRESLKNIRFRPYPNGEDALFGFECLCHAKCIAFMEAILYRYRRPCGKSANAMTLKNLRSCIDIAQEYKQVMDSWPYRMSVTDIAWRKTRSAI